MVREGTEMSHKKWDIIKNSIPEPSKSLIQLDSIYLMVLCTLWVHASIQYNMLHLCSPVSVTKV